VIAQPGGQHVGVGDRGLAETEAESDFGTQALSGTPGKKRLTVHRRRHVELSAQRRDPLRLDFGFVPWKPASVPKNVNRIAKPSRFARCLFITKA
jgi:hypothetical protein